MSRYDRMRRSSRVAPRRRMNPWVQLVMLVVALVLLLSFRERIAAGAAGCFGHMAAQSGVELGGGEGADAGPATGGGDGSERRAPGASGVEVRFLPKSKAEPSADVAPAEAPAHDGETAGDADRSPDTP